MPSCPVCQRRGEVLLSVRDVADRLRVDRSTVYALLARGELPRPGHVGRCTRWREADVDDYIRQRVSA